MYKIYIDLATHFGYAVWDTNKKEIVDRGNIDLEKGERPYWSNWYRYDGTFDTRYCLKMQLKVFEEFLNHIYFGKYSKSNTIQIYKNYIVINDDNKGGDKKVFDRHTGEELTKNYKIPKVSRPELITEEPAGSQDSYATLRKLYALHGIVDFTIGEHREIHPKTWFAGVRRMFPGNEEYQTKRVKISDGNKKFHYAKNDDGSFVLKIETTKTGIKKIHTKKTSKAIASLIINKHLTSIHYGFQPITDDNEADAICMAYWDNMKGEK